MSYGILEKYRPRSGTSPRDSSHLKKPDFFTLPDIGFLFKKGSGYPGVSSSRFALLVFQRKAKYFLCDCL